MLPYDAQHTKMKKALMLLVGNSSPDQPVYLHSLIRALVAGLQKQWIL